MNYLKSIITVCLLLASVVTIDAQTKSYKRGVGVNAMMEVDYEALAPATSWFYNWANTPPGDEGGTFVNYDMDFCPMFWNRNYDLDRLENWLKDHPETKYLLGYNEPNFSDQANMTPAEAAEDWPKIQEFAKEHGLKLVSPAVNWGTIAQYNDPCVWLDEFFSLLPDGGEGIDYIACHFYVPGANSLKTNVERLYKYNKPIWVTEFCAASGGISNSAQTQMDYMTETLQWLEQEDMVYRYAWFMARTGNSNWGAGINLLQSFPNQGNLTDVGKVFVNMSSFDEDFYFTTEQEIPAAHYIDASGVKLQVSTDDIESSAVLDVTDFADYMNLEFVEYNIDVPAAGDYNIVMRMAANSGTKMTVYSDENVIKEQFDVTNTGGKGKWATETLIVNLPAGKQRLRFEASGRMMQMHTLKVCDAAGINGVDLAPTFVVKGNSIEADGNIEVYGINGVKVGCENLCPGVYIVRTANGTSKVAIR